LCRLLDPCVAAVISDNMRCGGRPPIPLKVAACPGSYPVAPVVGQPCGSGPFVGVPTSGAAGVPIRRRLEAYFISGGNGAGVCGPPKKFSFPSAWNGLVVYCQGYRSDGIVSGSFRPAIPFRPAAGPGINLPRPGLITPKVVFLLTVSPPLPRLSLPSVPFVCFYLGYVVFEVHVWCSVARGNDR